MSDETLSLRGAAQQAIEALAECLYASTDKSERMANAALEALTAALASADEPAAWQMRRIDPEEGPSVWVDCHKSDVLIMATRKNYELRFLYAAIGAAK